MGTRTAELEVKLTFSSTIQNQLEDGQIPSVALGQSILSGKLTTGVGAQQSNRGWENRSELLTSGNTVDIDLFDFAGVDIGAGLGRDALGQILTIEEIVCLIIRQVANVSGATSGRLEIMPTSPAGAITWIPAMTVANGGALKENGLRMWYEDDTDALDIQDGVSHVLRLGAVGGDCTYEIYIAGRHDDDESSSSTSSSQSSGSSSSSSNSSSTSSTQSSSSSSQSSLSSSTQSSSSTT